MSTIDTTLDKEQVVKLTDGAFGSPVTLLLKKRVIDAVNVVDKKLIFSFNATEKDETAFYVDYITRVASYDLNPAKSKALYLKGQIETNAKAYTLAELAFLAKTLTLPLWTLPIFQSFEAWDNIARINPANLPTVFEQLLAGNLTGAATPPTTPPTPTPTTTETTTAGGIINGFLGTVLGGLAVYLLTRKRSKNE